MATKLKKEKTILLSNLLLMLEGASLHLRSLHFDALAAEKRYTHKEREEGR
jgi:hypothetical protein